jgi:hypothetical protein
LVWRPENSLGLCFGEHLYPTGNPVWSDDALGFRPRKKEKRIDHDGTKTNPHIFFVMLSVFSAARIIRADHRAS